MAEVIFSKETPVYICQPAATVKEAQGLIERGFSYECKIDGLDCSRRSNDMKWSR